MNSLSNLGKMRLAHGPGLRQRLERRMAGAHHYAVMDRLRRFRQGLERDMQPEPWTALQTPAVLLLADVCDALALSEDERAAILGPEGEQALAHLLQAPIMPRSPDRQERQVKALTYVRKCGRINLSLYRQLCPGLSNETSPGHGRPGKAWAAGQERGQKGDVLHAGSVNREGKESDV